MENVLKIGANGQNEPARQPIALIMPTYLQSEVLRLLGYELPGFMTVSPTGSGGSATRPHSLHCATSPILEIAHSDRIKIAYSDSTPKRLARLVALVPVEPNFQRIRYGCDLSNDVGRIQRPTRPHVKESKPLRALQRLDQPSGEAREKVPVRSRTAGMSARAAREWLMVAARDPLWK